MASPIFTTRSSSEAKLELKPEAKKLFQAVYAEQKTKDQVIDDDAPKIKVSTLISKMAFFYEKIRNSVDYNEEHLLRKNAIERILKRQIIIEGAVRSVNSVEIARHLLTELIRADYLPNNKIPETKIDEVAAIINRYLKLRFYALRLHKIDFQQKQDLTNWILAIAAAEIEQSLGTRAVIDLTVRYMYEVILKNIELPEGSPYEKDKEIQVFLGVHRSFLKFDDDMLSFILFKYFNGQWTEADDEQIKAVAANIFTLKEKIAEQLNHPLQKPLDRIISRYTVFFTILLDVIEEDPVAAYNYIKNDPKAWPRAIKRVCAKRYRLTKAKLWRAGVRSIIYIFLTKMVLAVILEVPVAHWLGEAANPLSLAINVGFPPFLLFLIILFTKLPQDDNTAKIIEGINEIIFVGHERKKPFVLRPPAKRSSKMHTIFTFIYAATFLVSFGFVVWVLRRLHFNIISIIIFLFFLTLVSFFSIRIRKSTRELIVVEPKESILSLLADFFYTPILEVGKWLSEKFSRINVFIFILDFIIEAPFKVFVEIADEWSKYVKERREEIG
jgi:hypothetical protein